MSTFDLELPLAIALAVSAGFSLLGLGFRRQTEGKVKLPITEDEADPFDVAKPEDVVDGAPVDAEKFWFWTKLQKIYISTLLTAVVVLQALYLGWIVSLKELENLPVHILHLVFALYVLIVALRAIGKRDAVHAQSVVHLFYLSLIATGLQVVVMLPAEDAETSVVLPQLGEVLPYLQYAVVVLYFLIAVLAGTTKRGPALYFPPEYIYSKATLSASSTTETKDADAEEKANVSYMNGISLLGALLFSYCTPVINIGQHTDKVEIVDLPVVTSDIRATGIYVRMRYASRRFKLHVGAWKPKPGSGWDLIYRIVRLNARRFAGVILQTALVSALYYAPIFCVNRLIRYLETDPERIDKTWGWIYCAGLVLGHLAAQLLTARMMHTINTMSVLLRIQLNSMLFGKTLVRKDVASSTNAARPVEGSEGDAKDKDKDENEKKEEGELSTKAQVMTLMTTDVDRIAVFARQLFTLINAPVELTTGTFLLYQMMGVSCLIGLGVMCLFLPLNHLSGKLVMGAQDNLMKARDERVGLMNEMLASIRMLKFMAWERSFEKKTMDVRARELKYQRLNYHIEILLRAIWNIGPIFVIVVTFAHYTIVRGLPLRPSTAFTTIGIFAEMKFGLNALPEVFIELLQSLVSIRRIEKYMNGVQVDGVQPLDGRQQPIVLRNVSITWPQDVSQASRPASAASTPRHRFTLTDVSVEFPPGELSLVCGKLGSGKTLLLLGLLGEADVLAGQLICPRSPPEAIAQLGEHEVSQENWIVPGACGYVPQTAWLRNASIRDNILFDLPYVEERYQATLEACALLSDLKILEDGDMSEIGERGVNLSGGQKARVSLARAVYSRASVLFLDDVLSAVDAHTAHHLYHKCLRGSIMQGRTVVLVSHHVRLCAPGASYVVALDAGQVIFQGDSTSFLQSPTLKQLVQSGAADPKDEEKKEEKPATIEEVADQKQPDSSAQKDKATNGTDGANGTAADDKKKAPRKLIDEEKRATGHISKDVWLAYFSACGNPWYWTLFVTAQLLSTASPVLENGWLRIWTGSEDDEIPGRQMFYVGIYGAVCALGVVWFAARWIILYWGSIHASTVMYKKLLEGVLFTNIRFHDTISRGRLLNRFGKDFEGVDSNLPDNLGSTIALVLAVLTTFITVTWVGGPIFLIPVVVTGYVYYYMGRIYSHISRELRRLDSVTRSPLYSIYGETIAGVVVVRAFGASTRFMRDMLRFVDTNTNPHYWSWGVNQWLSARLTVLSCFLVGLAALTLVWTPSISASTAGFTLAFANTLLFQVMFLIRSFVSLEQAMVAVERIKEFSDLPTEGAEYIEPRPPASWPENGTIECEDLVIRYAPELPDVLHKLTFSIKPGEKVGVLGRTGSGKSTLALSFFRFVEPTDGRIIIDGIDISKIGLADLRGRLTIIPQDPTIMSGTLRSTLDVLGEYEDADIYEALRRVHLIRDDDATEATEETGNQNPFRNLDSPVSEGGENFSTGERQLLCMARAILKRTKVLLMDEATASVDYATDELVGKTIRQEFAGSTILTIAHRLRTIIDYDRVMLLDNGHIAEFDSPVKLLLDPNSMFYGLCKATGKQEFAALLKMAGTS